MQRNDYIKAMKKRTKPPSFEFLYNVAEFGDKDAFQFEVLAWELADYKYLAMDKIYNTLDVVELKRLITERRALTYSPVE